MLFALMQEVLPIVIADLAKRKGTLIANFPILEDPRWQLKLLRTDGHAHFGAVHSFASDGNPSLYQPAKRGSGFPFTPNPLTANNAPPSGPGSMPSTFIPIVVT